MPKHDIVVMGASAGGVEALKTVLSNIPKDFPAAIFITLHTSPSEPSLLAHVLGAVCPLPVYMPKDKEKFEPGCVYVALPNLHLIIKRGYIQNRFLPKENGTRPAIDPMFRSAAHAYSRRVIGVLLTGLLDDGTAGLGVIQDEGGIIIVQDPLDAKNPEMPLAALESLKPDYIVPLDQIAPLLTELAETEVKGELPLEEPETKERNLVMTCPGCGGVLHQYTDDRTTWYQCRVGHRFSADSMMMEQNAVVEEHFWRIIAILKEKEDAARTMAADARSILNPKVSPEYYEKQVQASTEAIKRIYAILDDLGPVLFPAVPQEGAMQLS